MKKVRIMLAAIAVLGMVGGALAFKAKLIQPQCCIRATTLGPGACTGVLTNGLRTTNAVDKPTIFYTPKANPTPVNCTTINCALVTRVEPE